MMTTVLDIASWVLLTLGGISVLIGGIGALRLPDLFANDGTQPTRATIHLTDFHGILAGVRLHGDEHELVELQSFLGRLFQGFRLNPFQVGG